MAKYIGLGADEPRENSEYKVARALKHLSDDWVILHHVSWQSKRGGRQGDGEADFILLHAKKGILVIEVKGGGIDIEAGRWHATDRYGIRHSIKNPYEQAAASKHALLAWLDEHGFGKKMRIGHAVVFPHMRDLPLVGPAGPPQISLTKPRLDNIAPAINDCFEHWKLEANMSATDIEKIIALLAPTVSIMPKLSGQSSDAEADILIFTKEQIEAFSGLRAGRGGLILGGAGTGKTVLAVARARQLARDGFRTLLVCYNELLGTHLASRVEKAPHLTCCTYHTLCLREAHRATLKIPHSKPPTWWEKEAPSMLRESCVINEPIFDAVVIDEGQDFSLSWFDSLRHLISAQPDAPFFIFADPLQDIWKRDWFKVADHPFVWELKRNMRNTQPIAARVAAAVDLQYQGKGVSGPIPVWRNSTGKSGEKEIVSAVEHLLEEGFGPSNLVVLCGSAALATQLRERTIGQYSLGKWGGRGIVAETISRFKGLEAQAIVVALTPITSPENRIEAYVGMSRARSMLLVIGSKEDQQQIKWQNEKS